MSNPSAVLGYHRDIKSEYMYNGVSIYADNLFDDEQLLFYAHFKKPPSRVGFKIPDETFLKIMAEFFAKDYKILVEEEINKHGQTNINYWISETAEIIIKTHQATHEQEGGTYKKSAKKQKKDYSLDIVYAADNTKFKETITNIKAFIEKEKADTSLCIHILEKEANYMELTPHTLEHFPLDIHSHYNDGFAAEHERIVEWANDVDSVNQRLALFHGIPGAGKTNYIKYLMTQLPDIRKIYIPPFFVDAIADPAFMSFIKDYEGSLLIAEDCESILQKRETSSNASAASILLNLTDGILASILKFKIICTFNSPESEIDPALLRKGRLFSKYKFDKLSETKTQALFQKLYGKNPPEKEMDLASIYNEEENGNQKKEEKRMGFGV